MLFYHVQSVYQKSSSWQIINIIFQGKTYGFDKASHELVEFVFLKDQFRDVAANLLNEVVEWVDVIDLFEFLVEFIDWS